MQSRSGRALCPQPFVAQTCTIVRQGFWRLFSRKRQASGRVLSITNLRCSLDVVCEQRRPRRHWTRPARPRALQPRPAERPRRRRFPKRRAHHQPARRLSQGRGQQAIGRRPDPLPRHKLQQPAHRPRPVVRGRRFAVRAHFASSGPKRDARPLARRAAKSGIVRHLNTVPMTAPGHGAAVDARPKPKPKRGFFTPENAETPGGRAPASCAILKEGPKGFGPEPTASNGLLLNPQSAGVASAPMRARLFATSLTRALFLKNATRSPSPPTTPSVGHARDASKRRLEKRSPASANTFPCGAAASDDDVRPPVCRAPRI